MQCIESDINIKNVQVATAAILIQIRSAERSAERSTSTDPSQSTRHFR